MWRSIAALIALASLAGPASAVSVRPGIEVGGSYLTFVRGSGSGPYSSDWSLHPSFGLLVGAEFPRRVVLGAGVRWAQGGTRSRADDLYFHDSNRARESWLTADLTVQPGLPLRLRAVVGVEAAYRLSGAVSGHFVSPAGDQPYDQDYTTGVRRGDLRLKAGIAYEFPVARHRGSWTWRYVEGLVSQARPAAYLNPLERNIAWTGSPSPVPGGATRVRAVETGITLYW